MAEMTMPALGADMTQGKVTQWLVKPGDRVRHGDVVAVVDTDKAEIEIECFADGVVQELVVGEGERVPVGATIARIAGEGEPVVPPRTPAPPPPPSLPAAAAPRVERRHVTPLARRVAADLGVDLAGVPGTGPGGAVTREDVERAAAGGPAPKPERKRAPKPRARAPHRAAPARTDAMREAIAQLMARSKREVPHYYLESTLDFGRAQAFLDDVNAQRPAPQRLLPAALLLRAVAQAAREHPQLNGHWLDGRFRAAEHVHLGVAVSLRGGGVVAPAILDADRLSADELMERLTDLVARVRSGRLRGREMTDATITVTQLGERGADLVHGVIYVPQVALVGFGRIRERPWAQDGMVGARPTVVATLAGDHRASDGHAGGLLLEAVDRSLQEPA
jgi:pyruvate dehydrogenase E2 component (dihydrolipoamide acetyltransferase)